MTKDGFRLRVLGGERTVHAHFGHSDASVKYGGSVPTEVVRYARARRWYVERDGQSKPVSVEEAAREAADGVALEWTSRWGVVERRADVAFGLPGGALFDRLVAEACPMIEPVEVRRVGALEIYARCPTCRCWMAVDGSQATGGGCFYHTEPGCGFHGYVIGPNRGYVCSRGDRRWPGSRRAAA